MLAKISINGEEMKLGKVRIFQITAVIVGLGVVAILVMGSPANQTDSGQNVYTTRPTFFNLPVIVFSNSSYTDEIREHLSYCTFHYEITTNASHLANASANVPIIVDGYSLGKADDGIVAEACSKALKNGSIIITLWSHAYDFMNSVSNIAYGHGVGVFADNGADILWLGLSHGNNSVQASKTSYHDSIGPYGPSMTTLTQAYEWSVREVYDQPYHPTLYP